MSHLRDHPLRASFPKIISEEDEKTLNLSSYRKHHRVVSDDDEQTKSIRKDIRLVSEREEEGWSGELRNPQLASETDLDQFAEEGTDDNKNNKLIANIKRKGEYSDREGFHLSDFPNNLQSALGYEANRFQSQQCIDDRNDAKSGIDGHHTHNHNLKYEEEPALSPYGFPSRKTDEEDGFYDSGGKGKPTWTSGSEVDSNKNDLEDTIGAYDRYYQRQVSESKDTVASSGAILDVKDSGVSPTISSQFTHGHDHSHVNKSIWSREEVNSAKVVDDEGEFALLNMSPHLLQALGLASSSNHASEANHNHHPSQVNHENAAPTRRKSYYDAEEDDVFEEGERNESVDISAKLENILGLEKDLHLPEAKSGDERHSIDSK